MMLVNNSGVLTLVVDTKDTSDRLLFAAINLIAKKGYHAVSTKEIAKEASVSEMTLFRHFGTKKAMLEAAIDRFYYTTSMKELFENKVVWDLEKDLLMVSKVYLSIMKKNQNVIRIAIKEGNSVEGLYEQINKHPRQLKKLLLDYFSNMQQQGKIKKVENLEGLTMSYLYMLYGQFISRNFVEGQHITYITEEEFIRTSVLLLVNVLKT